MADMIPKFFRTADSFRNWLKTHHATAHEIWVGYYKKDSGKPSITWPESVDEALCFGWIDGIRKTFGAGSYCIRFTPRRPKSTWSLINIRKVRKLSIAGRMTRAGLELFEQRDRANIATSSFERPLALTPQFTKVFRVDKPAWGYFQRQTPLYRRLAAHWVMSAKKEETRARRLETLIRDSSQRQLIKAALRPERKGD